MTDAQTDTQTDATERITTPHLRVVACGVRILFHSLPWLCDWYQNASAVVQNSDHRNLHSKSRTYRI